MRCIYCPTCAQKSKIVNGTLAADEWRRVIKGITRASFICDYCGEPLARGSRAVAASIMKEPYRLHAWEQEYLIVDE